jgi:hypothetical protein
MGGEAKRGRRAAWLACWWVGAVALLSACDGDGSNGGGNVDVPDAENNAQNNTNNA